MSENNSDPAEEKSKPKVGTGIDPKLIEMLKETMAVPMPSKDDYWQVEAILQHPNQGKRLFGLLKKKDLPLAEINDLRKSAIQAPGNTRVIINKMIKKHPGNPTLLMLSAVCTHGMLLNSSDKSGLLNGLKSATKDSAMSLLSDGISVYNCENFFKIYFTMLDRFKRSQIKAYDTVRQDPRLERYKSHLTASMKVTDMLMGEKTKSMTVLGHVKKKLKTTSFYTTVITFNDIMLAGRMVERGEAKKMCGIAKAGEIIAYVYALSLAFSRIPILGSLVEKILEILPGSCKPINLRRISIRTSQRLLMFKIAAFEGAQKRMQAVAAKILQENAAGMQLLDGQALYQSYETDPFFNTAIITELAVGVLKNDREKLLQKAKQAVENVIKRDMSKGNAFTDYAKTHSHRLSELLSEETDGEDQRSKASPKEENTAEN